MSREDEKSIVTKQVEKVFDEWRVQLESDQTMMDAIARGEKINVTLFCYRGRAVRQPQLERLPTSGPWRS